MAIYADGDLKSDGLGLSVRPVDSAPRGFAGTLASFRNPAPAAMQEPPRG
jgi:hypothetical protein